MHMTLRAIALSALATIATVISGCGGGSSGSSAEPSLVVVNFNHDLLPGVLLNSPLVFTFSADVDPLSINSNTIQIFASILGQRVDATGEFQVNGRTVTWFPSMTRFVYPLGAQNPGDPLMPTDHGLNAVANQALTYSVSIPGAPSSNTVKSNSGKALQETFSSSFQTAQGPTIGSGGNSQTVTGLFDAQAPFFRDTIRVADVLAYGGTLSPPTGYRGWLVNPASSVGENPLFIAPGFLQNGIDGWTGRDRTGAFIDARMGIAITPPLSAAEMQNNAFPTGAPAGDERFISNLTGTQLGRGREVEGVNIYFTQPLGSDSFLTMTNNPKPPTGPNSSPIAIRVLATAGQDPNTATEEQYTLDFLNDTELQAAFVQCTLNRQVGQGWIDVQILANGIKGMPGGQLETNLATSFRFIWPVRVNAP